MAVKISPDFVFAKRTGWPLSSNRIAQVLERLKKGGGSFWDLTESNPTRCGFSYPSRAILAALDDERNLLYEPCPCGSPRAREAIARDYHRKGVEVAPENIILTAGTSEAYSHLFRLLVNSGEKVLFPSPSYPLFQFLGDLNDVQLTFYPLIHAGQNWGIDFNSLEEMSWNGVKAMVLVNPNNPTGSFIKRDELDTLNRICRAKNLPLISDDVFADFPLTTPAPGVSLAGNREVLTFVLGGLSKTLGLPQMKLSWIILSGPEFLVKAARQRLEVIADTYLSVGTPVQNALEGWLAFKDPIQEEIRARLTRNLDFLKKETRGGPCAVWEPEGGWYAVLKIPRTHGEEEWVLKFLEEDGVFVHPGYFFDFSGEAFIVVSLLPPVEVFEEGLRRIVRRIRGSS